MRNSKIILSHNINLDVDMVNVLDLSEADMVNLCEANKVASANNYSFIRNNDILFTEIPYDTCLQATYLAFQNPDYSNKWFFAFITDIVYKGDRNTEIQYKIDSWSTWFSYWTPKTCYVLREHVNNDTIGANIIEENIEIGTPIQIGTKIEQGFSGFGYIAVDTNYVPDSDTFTSISMKNGIIRGCKTVVFNYNLYGYEDLFKFLLKAQIDGKQDWILTLYYIPAQAITVADLVQHTFTYTVNSTTITGDYYTYPDSMEVISSTYSFTKVNSWPDYTPKNNKCYVWPYNYLLVTNNSGSANSYKYEFFTDLQFRLEYASTVGGSGRLVPLHYKGQERLDDEAIPIAKFPTFSWASDSYTNWLTQNAIDIPLKMATTVVGTGTSLATGNIPTAVSTSVSLGSTIGNLASSDYQARLLPPVQHGGNNGDVLFSSNRNVVSFVPMRCDLQHIRIIDDYFTRVGYKVNRLKVPNLTGRRNFNYIEISGTDEIGVGNVPNKYWTEINNLARRGITIWHNHNNVGNYNVQNDII